MNVCCMKFYFSIYLDLYNAKEFGVSVSEPESDSISRSLNLASSLCQRLPTSHVHSIPVSLSGSEHEPVFESQSELSPAPLPEPLSASPFRLLNPSRSLLKLVITSQNWFLLLNLSLSPLFRKFPCLLLRLSAQESVLSISQSLISTISIHHSFRVCSTLSSNFSSISPFTAYTLHGEAAFASLWFHFVSSCSPHIQVSSLELLLQARPSDIQSFLALSSRVWVLPWVSCSVLAVSVAAARPFGCFTCRSCLVVIQPRLSAWILNSLTALANSPALPVSGDLSRTRAALQRPERSHDFSRCTLTCCHNLGRQEWLSTHCRRCLPHLRRSTCAHPRHRVSWVKPVLACPWVPMIVQSAPLSFHFLHVSSPAPSVSCCMEFSISCPA